MNKLVNLSGKKFGRWNVISHSHVTRTKSNSTVHHWNCKCDCGIYRVVRGDSLTRQHTKSCGCINKQVGKKHPTWKGYEDISATLWKQYQWSAKTRKLPFTVTIEDAWSIFKKQDGRCAFTGLTLSFPKDARDTTSNASIDRVDSSQGYVKDNIQWVDKRINFMKYTLSADEFVELCHLVSNKMK
jgi:hypothetical protein